MKNFIRAAKGVCVFLFIWAALLIISPLLILFILAQAAWTVAFPKKKVDKVRKELYIKCTNESEYPFSAN